MRIGTQDRAGAIWEHTSRESSVDIGFAVYRVRHPIHPPPPPTYHTPAGQRDNQSYIICQRRDRLFVMRAEYKFGKNKIKLLESRIGHGEFRTQSSYQEKQQLQ